MIFKQLIKALSNIYREEKARKRISEFFPGLTMEKNVLIKGPLSKLKLGNPCLILSGAVIHLGNLEWCNFEGELTIGNRAVISPNVVIYATGSTIKIGNDFDCGPGVVISCSKTNIANSGRHDFEEVKIGNNVTLYSNVVVSPGAKIGSNCVIGANSVVVNDIPDNCLAIGNPAKVIKQGIRQ